jgi:uncharacterized protein (DUF433 family)
MISPPEPVAVPLRTDQHGVIRVGSTRVPLETVIHAFQNGATPEQIVYRFPVLKLADVYAVITYYLHHETEVNDYLRRAEAEGEQVRREVEARHPDMIGIRERLLARLEEKKKQS